MSEKELAREAFEAGYKTRELDVRADDSMTQLIIERNFKQWWRNHE